MILLRQKQYADENRMPRSPEELRKLLKDERDKGFEAGRKKGAAEKRVSIEERAQRIHKLERKKKIQAAKDKVKEEAGKIKKSPAKYFKSLKPVTKGALIGTAMVGSAGVAYGVSKAVKKEKAKKKEIKLKEAVRGYEK